MSERGGGEVAFNQPKFSVVFEEIRLSQSSFVGASPVPADVPSPFPRLSYGLLTCLDQALTPRILFC